MNALEIANYIASMSYTNEFCAVCGCAIKIDMPKTSVWTEVNGNRIQRPAHEECCSNQMHERAFINQH